MFLALFAAFLFATATLAARLSLPHPAPGAPFTPGFFALNEALLILPAGLASLVMAWVEKENFGIVCGLADAKWWRRCLGGFAAGAGALAVLALMLCLSGHAGLRWGGLHGGMIGVYALIWAAVSLLIGFTEEFAFRGYLFRVLRQALGDYRALAVTSLIFGGLHYHNSGEGWLGVCNAALAGLVLALLIRRTGSLWASIGLHGGWDYGENFIFGAPDSGQSCAFTLLQLSPLGAPWLSGGMTGPEGSVFASAVLSLAGLTVLAWGKTRPASSVPPCKL
jgi:membrane protease YdiL (CAAX protease family)